MNVDRKRIQEVIAALKGAEAIDVPFDPRQIGKAQAHCIAARCYLESVAHRFDVEQSTADAADFISTTA